MKKRIRISVCASAFVFACFLVLASVAHAATIPTQVTIDPVGTVRSGVAFTVTGSLHRPVENGTAGIGDRRVKLYLETITTASGVISPTSLIAIVSPDKDGHLKWVVHKRLLVGHYRLYFWYQGSPQLWGSMASTDLNVIPGPPPAKHVHVYTTPVQLSVSATTRPIDVGEMTTVTVQLASQSVPLANYLVHFRLPGATEQRVTNVNGTAVFVIKKPLTPGQNNALIEFHGKGVYMPAKQQVQITVNPPAPTTLTFETGDKQIYIGDRNAFVAQLAANGQPVVNRLVRLYLDGKMRYGAVTDKDGKATLRLPHDMVAGQHVISATFHGVYSLIKSQVVLPITLLPKPFEVHTVPRLANVKILVGEKMIQTDAQGIARLLIEKPGMESVTILPYESADPNMRAAFIRWSDEVFSATRKINVINGKTYQIGFELSYPVSQRFVEETAGRAVDVARLSNITLASSSGEAITLNAFGTQWFKANRIIRHDDTLVASRVAYSVHDVTVDGVNVVNQGQQRFEVAPNTNWTVKLQMYDMSIVVRDALFGFPIGKSVHVVHPTGQSQDIPLDAAGQMRVESLARGSYMVTVQGASGILTPTPISLSRTQEVQLQVISYLDIGVVGGAVVLIALLVLLVGRPGLLTGLRRVALRRAVAA